MEAAGWMDQGAEHIALIKGNIEDGEPVLVRMHSMDPPGCRHRANWRAAEFSVLCVSSPKGARCLTAICMKLAAAKRSAHRPTPIRVGRGFCRRLGFQADPHDQFTNTKGGGTDAYGLEIVGTRKISELG